MDTLLRLEELLMFALGVFLFTFLNYAWWVFLVLILTPDVSMIGYALNANVGAYCYNLLHHKGIGTALFIFGWIYNWEAVALAGIILFSHSALDRVFGYGLKFTDSFQHTHLGNLNASNK